MVTASVSIKQQGYGINHHQFEHIAKKSTQMSLSIELQNHISLNTVDHFKQANAHWNRHEVDYHKQVIILRKGLVENPT